MPERANVGKDAGQRRQVHAPAGQSFWRELVQHVVVESGDGQRRDFQLVQRGEKLRLHERTQDPQSR